MKMKNRPIVYVILLCCLSLLLAGCGKGAKDIKVTGFRLVSITPEGMSGLTALVEIGLDNPIVGFELTDVSITVDMHEQPAVVFEADQLMVEGHCAKTYSLPLKGRIVDTFNPFQLLKLFSNEDSLDNLKASARARVALRGGIGKNIEIKDIPLKDLIDNL